MYFANLTKINVSKKISLEYKINFLKFHKTCIINNHTFQKDTMYSVINKIMNFIK